MTDSIDRAWFKKNPNANCRVRRPAPGEVEEIMRRSHGALPYEIAALGGAVECPDPEKRWAILVVSVDPKTMMKMVTIQPMDAPDEPTEAGWSFYSIALMNRAFIVKLGG
jgi:hypothetical protein